MKKKIIIIICIIIATVALSVFAATTGVSQTFAGTKKRSLPVYSVERDDKKIAITFDCAWGVDHTDEIIETVKKNQINCTFFAVRFWVEKYPEYVKKLHDNGIEIGTHSATHSHMAKMSASEIKEELVSSSEAIERITGEKVTLFRAPFGEYDDEVIDGAKALGLTTVQWDVDSLDWKDLSAEQISKRIVSQVSSGSIILCHNNGLHTAEALPLVIADLKNKGYEFVTVGELLLRGETTIDNNGRQRPI